MATAHAFRICENDYSGAAGSGWDDDPGVTTTVGGGNVVANFHVAKNWHAVCRAAVHRLKVSAGVSSGWRIVIIEYDTGDIISTTGAGATDTTMQDEETRTPVTDDKTRHLISQGNPVDEFTTHEIGRLAARAKNIETELDPSGTPYGSLGKSVAEILAAHSL
jgi:hypothetical protein